MNKVTLLLMFTFCACFCTQAQRRSPDENRGAGREKIQAAHAAYITTRLELTPVEAEKFWPIYREYSEKRRALRQQLREERQSADSEQSRLDLGFEIRQKELDLEKEYYARMAKVTSAQKIAKLRQADADFRKLLFRQIQKRGRR